MGFRREELSLGVQHSKKAMAAGLRRMALPIVAARCNSVVKALSPLDSSPSALSWKTWSSIRARSGLHGEWKETNSQSAGQGRAWSKQASPVAAAAGVGRSHLTTRVSPASDSREGSW